MFKRKDGESLLNVKDMFNSKVIIDINEELMLIEEICLHHKDYVLDRSCLFTLNNRFPIICKADLGNSPISEVPLYPIVSAALAKEAIIEYFADNKHRELYISNPLLVDDTVPEKFLLPEEGIENVVKNFVDRPLRKDDLNYVVDVLDAIMVKLEFFKLPKGYIFDIDIESKYFIIKPIQHICEYRMKEAGYF